MLDFIRTYRRNARLGREIDGLDQRVLNDLGVSRSGLRKLTATPRAVLQRLTAMARRQQVPQHTLMGDLMTLPTLVEQCSACRSTRACAAFLADSSAPTEQAGFCPNQSAFRRMRAEATPH